jgi:hypothetical protein
MCWADRIRQLDQVAGGRRRRQSRLLVTMAPVLCLAAFQGQAWATDYYWICGTNSWCTPSCWNPTGIPTGDNGAFIDNGGTATIATGCSPNVRYLYLGSAAGTSGHVLQTGSTATIENIYDGYRGSGTYTLNGGTLRVDWLQMGDYTGSTGSFTQAAGATVEGYDPPADPYVEYLRIGVGTDCNGTYTMNGGTLRVWHARVGYDPGCNGTITQNGGTVYNEKDGGAYLRLAVGYTNSGVPGRGTYTMNNDATLYTTKIETYSGVATFNQNDFANVIITEALSLVGSQDDDGPALATYKLESGYLSADIEYVGYVDGGPGSAATFNHAMGGTNEVNYLYLGYGVGANGTYNIPILADAHVRAGELHVGVDGHGFLNIGDPECHITISQRLSLGADCELHVAPEEPRCSIWMNGASFENHCSSEAALVDLIQLKLTFGCEETVVSDFEVAGEDKGCANLDNNFALGHLRIGAADVAHVRLVDNIDNGNRNGVGGSAEALYVADLTLQAGSTLDLNGLHLYCENLIDDSGTVLNGTIMVLGPPTITGQPEDQTACVGESAAFCVVAGGTPPFDYQWRRGTTPLYDGGNITGANTATLIIDPVAPADAASNYNCVVTNACGSATSGNASLTVNTPVAITAHPVSQTACVGGSVSFAVTATGTLPLEYQWWKNGIEIPGAEQNNYTIDTVELDDAGDYHVVVTNDCGDAISDTATLTVCPSIPGDLDHDCDVDLQDLASLLANYAMPSGASYEDGDLDGDGDVDLSDLAGLLGHYGEAGC